MSVNKLERPVGFRYLMAFSIPTILSHVCMGIYGVVDGIFASNCIGTDALSCVNICMPVVMITIMIGTMLGTGGNALVAKKLGEGKEQEAKEDFTLLLIFGVAVCILVSVLCYIFRYPLVEFLGADPKLMDGCVQYVLPTVALMPLNIPGVILEMTVITVGKPKLGLAASMAGGITNIFLDWLFIAQFGWGLTGAALATGIGYCVPSVFGLVYFAVKRRQALYFVKPRWRWRSITKSCGNGASEMVGLLAWSISTVLMNNILMDLSGSDAVAAVSIVLYVQSIFTAVTRGYSVGISPVISYKFGKRDLKELHKTFRIGLITSFVMAMSVMIICFFGAPVMVSLFAPSDTSPVVYDMAVYGFRIFVFSMVFEGINIMASALFTAINDGLTSAVISFARTFVFVVIPLIVLSKILGLLGVWLAFPVSEIMAFLISGFFLLKLRKDVWIYRREGLRID